LQMDEISVGVIGFGLAGQIFHAAVINETPGLRVAAIVERSGHNAALKYPQAKTVTTVDALLADPSIQLCIVATPNDTHTAIAGQCLRAGRHVVVDKPLALSSADAAELAATARASGSILSAFHNRRWDGDFRTLQQLLKQDTIGTPFSFESHFDRFRMQPRPGAWRETEAAGGGILFDLGPHLIDQALALFGHPSSVWADVRTMRPDATVDDSFDLVLAYEHSTQPEFRKLRSWLRCSMVTAAPGARFTLHGSGGTYVKWGLDPQENALKQGARFADDGFGEENSSAWGIFQAPDGLPHPVPTLRGDYRQYYANVRDAIFGKAPLAVGIASAWSVARIMELARESSHTGNRVSVDLSPAAAL
jgi:scyllo-inositol 2-dehydrogenase (NADP+)